MATATSTMASQLNNSLATFFTRGVVTPKGISGKPLRVLPSSGKSTFTIKAVQSDKPTYQVNQPINGDPFIRSLETPVTSSPLIAWYVSNLHGYRMMTYVRSGPTESGPDHTRPNQYNPAHRITHA